MIHRAKNHQGFTLVELMLALAFVGFIILFIVFAVMQVMRTYNKGVTIKEINQTARATVEDMARTTRTSSTIVTSALADSRVCFGSISYVWNPQGGSANKYDSTGNPPVTFVRVEDPGGAMCVKVGASYPNVPSAKAASLLTDRVWVQMMDLSVNTPNKLTTITIQLSTPEDITNPTLEDPFPATPPNPTDSTTWVRCKGGTGGEFCAVATFSTTVALRGDE
ncbi:MAG TPA: prepilin-type N-terminal cleavage/methylation domain-containing protein [Candidatus Saccharimonadales bacterium]|nr:prepilin-type N-terminal cleavage/methylation domain-containing protein [Candidatus Saccharimonadales bacterium]